MNLECLLNNVRVYNKNEEELQMISKAYHCAERLHSEQKRQSGEPYIIHPLSVAIILSEIEADTNTIVAGLLHDTLEDTDIKKDGIAHEFNPHIAMLVEGVTKIGKINFSRKEDETAGNTRKLLSGITEDVRIVLIKLADRLHNMRTLEFKKTMAFEVTKLVHGEEEALKVKQASEALFAGANNLNDVPSYYMNREEFVSGIDLAELMVKIQLATSKSEVRRLLEQGGIYINNLRVTEIPKIVGKEDIVDNTIILRKGKKMHMKVVVD